MRRSDRRVCVPDGFRSRIEEGNRRPKTAAFVGYIGALLKASAI